MNPFYRTQEEVNFLFNQVKASLPAAGRCQAKLLGQKQAREEAHRKFKKQER